MVFIWGTFDTIESREEFIESVINKYVTCIANTCNVFKVRIVNHSDGNLEWDYNILTDEYGIDVHTLHTESQSSRENIKCINRDTFLDTTIERLITHSINILQSMSNTTPSPQFIPKNFNATSSSLDSAPPLQVRISDFFSIDNINSLNSIIENILNQDLNIFIDENDQLVVFADTFISTGNIMIEEGYHSDIMIKTILSYLYKFCHSNLYDKLIALLPVVDIVDDIIWGYVPDEYTFDIITKRLGITILKHYLSDCNKYKVYDEKNITSFLTLYGKECKNGTDATHAINYDATSADIRYLLDEYSTSGNLSYTKEVSVSGRSMIRPGIITIFQELDLIDLETIIPSLDQSLFKRESPSSDDNILIFENLNNVYKFIDSLYEELKNNMSFYKFIKVNPNIDYIITFVPPPNKDSDKKEEFSYNIYLIFIIIIIIISSFIYYQMYNNVNSVSTNRFL